MKGIVTAIILSWALASCTSGEETADDIIEKNITARGGYEKIKSLRSVIFEGTVIARKSVATKVTYDHLHGMRTDYMENGKTAYTILTHTAGWTFNPFSDTAARPIPLEYVLDGIFQLDIQGLFVDYKDKGYKAIYEGKDTAAGKQCFKIRLTKEAEGDKIYLFDENYLLLKGIIYRLTSEGKYQPNEFYFYDYRKNADGYLFSYRRASATTQTIVDKVTTNTTIPASVFEPGH